MPVSEFGAATRLVAAAADGVTTVVRDMHRAIAARAFPRGTGAVKLAHDGIVELTYGCVRGGLRAGGGLASLLPVHRFSLQRSAVGRRAGAVLGGYVGDRLHNWGDPLVYDMAVRAEGTDIAPEWTSLRAVYPNPSGELVVFLHGLIESEQWWFPRDHPDFGTRLATDLGITPVYLRYNTGRHICDNAAALDALLTTVLKQWPVPVTGLSLIGHSMGGLPKHNFLTESPRFIG
ncbi:MAG: esterase/lipase family protein [Sciscionella sp.]